MILVTTASQPDGYRVTAIKGIVRGPTFDELLCQAQQLDANAVVRADYSDALGGAALFYGAAVLVERNHEHARTLS